MIPGPNPAAPPPPAAGPGPFHLMAKPAGPRCPLDCRYCFYAEKAVLFPGGPGRMSDGILAAYVRRVAEESPGDEIAYSWQGGEPALAGLDFFRRAVAWQKEAARGRRVANAFQTNGLLLDDDWCDFLAREGFLVGLSLDGPRPLHDAYRRDRAGEGTHGRTMETLRRLIRHGVSFNTLSVVHDRNARRPLEVYRFLRDAGARHMQFIPAVERWPAPGAAAPGLRLAPPPGFGSGGGRVTPWSVAPEAYGGFLCALFDEWMGSDVGRVFIRDFESALGAWLGRGGSLCHWAETCGRSMVVEADGSVYACDHYVYSQTRRGHLAGDRLRDLFGSPEQTRFGLSKREALSGPCRACRFLFACWGGCPKHRFRPVPGGGPPVSHLCAGYLRFFSHAGPGLDRLARGIGRGSRDEGPRPGAPGRGRERGAGRNDPCPCGSGRKVKACCGLRPGPGA